MSAFSTNGFDLLGAELVEAVPRPMSWTRGAIAIAAGALGAVLVPKHPVLAFLGTAAIASNAHAAVKGERSWQTAIKRVGRHVVATVGSLSVPKYPAMGYVAGAVAADLFIDGQGGGIIDEWTDYEGIRDLRPRDVIDAEYTETKSPAVALQKVT